MFCRKRVNGLSRIITCDVADLNLFGCDLVHSRFWGRTEIYRSIHRFRDDMGTLRSRSSFLHSCLLFSSRESWHRQLLSAGASASIIGPHKPTSWRKNLDFSSSIKHLPLHVINRSIILLPQYYHVVVDITPAPHASIFPRRQAVPCPCTHLRYSVVPNHLTKALQDLTILDAQYHRPVLIE